MRDYPLVTVTLLEDEEFSMPLTEAVDLLKDLLDKVPEDCVESAKIEIDTTYESSNFDVQVYYLRPMTDAEKADWDARRAGYRDRQIAEARQMIERGKLTLARLGEKL